MDQNLTLKEISDLTGRPVSTLRALSVGDKWNSFEEPGRGRGGIIRKYPVKDLPDDIQLLYNKVKAEAMANSTLEPVHANALPPSLSRRPHNVPVLSQKQQSLALAKTDLVRHYKNHMKTAPWGAKEQHRKDFMRAYNAGIIFPRLYQVIGKTNWKTIEGWKRKLKSSGNDPFALGDTRGKHSRGVRVLTKEQQDIVLRCALNPNRPKISYAIRMAWAVMHAQGVANGNSESTYRRFLMEWKSRNYHIWVFTREGEKAWNDKCARFIERDYSRIDVGDVLVADGHHLNFDIINPFTGKPKRMVMILWYDMKSSFPLGWEIMPTENTQAIHAALRRAILRLGKTPQVVYLDNGKAFKSRFFRGVDFDQEGYAGVYDRLGAKTIYAWPYHGQSKTVERFFGTFAELETWLPTYVGTSITLKPPRMNRGEKLHRRVYEKIMGGGGITMEMAHRAIAGFLDEYVRREKKFGYLKGLSPLEVFLNGRGSGVDKSELTYLMMSHDIRKIRRNGIHIFGQYFDDPALYGRKHGVTIRYDLQEPTYLLVYDKDGEFLCKAVPSDKVHPAATHLGTDEDRALLSERIEEKQSQKKQASVVARTFLEEEILPEHRRQLERMGVTQEGPKQLPAPATKTPEKLPTDEEIQEALREQAQFKAEFEPPLQEASADTSEVVDFEPYVEDETALFWRELESLSKMDQYEKLLEVQAQGWLIPKEWQAFMRYYEQTDEYSRHAGYWEHTNMSLALMYQTEAADAADQK